MKYVALVLVLVILGLGAALTWTLRKIDALAEQQERAALEAVQKAREAVSADLQGLREQGARLRVQIDRQQAEVTRLRATAATAAKETAFVVKRGEVLRAASADDVIREAALRGYTVRYAAPRAVPAQQP